MPDSYAEMFMKYDYAEMKDILKTFLTLVSASVVFSITFSEKVIKYDAASSFTRRVVICAWGAMIFALIMGGASLFLIASAAGKVIYGSIPFFDFDAWALEYFSVLSAIIGGVVYIASLVFLIVAVNRGAPRQGAP